MEFWRVFQFGSFIRLPDSLRAAWQVDDAGWFAYGTVTLVVFEAVLSAPKPSTLLT